jgi:hypothetical protein
MRKRSMVSIAVLATTMIVGCAKSPNDAAIVTSIQSQMFSDQQLKDSNIQVSSNQRKVTLTGTVSSDAAHLDAYKIASETPGVVSVDDQTSVQTAQALPLPALEPSVQAPPQETRKHKPSSKRDPHRAEDLEAAQPPPVAENPAPQTTQDADSSSQPSAAAVPASPPPSAPPQPKQVEIPAGTTLTVRMIDAVDSSVNNPGEIFHGSLENPIVIGDDIVVSKGADIYVRLSAASSAGKFAGKSELHLELIKLESHGRSYPLVSSTYSVSGSSRGKDTATKVGGGAAIGAIIGAIAGGGKGAAIGAGVGGAGGGAYQAATHGKQVRIPSETKLDFQLEQPVTVALTGRQATTN